MYLTKITRYPIKGFPGDPLSKGRLITSHGIQGDRRFAFGVDASKDDGTWYPSRSYLVNSRKDNLLKFAQRSHQNAWEITSPSGQVLHFDANDPDSLKRVNGQLGSFLNCVENGGKTPCLIDRNPDDGPKGHWDFPDTELLMVNLATLRELERHWNIKIDPRRFRANLLIDGLPAWAEFGLYGTEFAVGAAKITLLRPARRCAAVSVNPTTGDRDVAVQNDLVKDYGHGFIGVYARVTQSGDVVVGDEMQRTNAQALAVDDITCELAPDVSLWPKTASAVAKNAPDVFEVSALGAVPLAGVGAIGRMKLHLGPKAVSSAEILQSSAKGVTLRVNPNSSAPALDKAPNRWIVLSGPFGTR